MLELSQIICFTGVIALKTKFKGLLFKGSFGIPDKSIDELLSAVNSSKAIEFFRSDQTDKKFIGSYEKWLFSNKDYSIYFDKSKFHPYIALGTTQSFHDFYQINYNRNLKIKKGEYPYHKTFFNSINRKWGWIDDEGITSNDFIILSYPFSGNGGVNDVEEILELCNKYAVPVLLDCAFWGLSGPLSLHLNQYPCIKVVSFSLSKFFNVGRLRIGMMYSQYKEQASAAILAPYHYINSWSAYIGLQLINNFSIKYMNKKYRSIQKNICRALKVSPSETLLFGLSQGKEWKDFQRDGVINRICLSQAIYEEYKKAYL